MDLKTARRLTESHLKSLLVVLLVFGAAFITAVVRLGKWDEALRDRDTILTKRELNVQSRENDLQQREKAVSVAAAAVQQERESLARQRTQIEEAGERVSGQARQAKVEDQLAQMMNDFSALGIDLDKLPACDDAEEIKRYRSAKAKMDAIEALARANHLSKYFVRDDGFGTWDSRGCGDRTAVAQQSK